MAFVARLGCAIEYLHSSGPFRSIIEPVSCSIVDRPIRKATGTVSVSLGGVSRDTSKSVGIMETCLNLPYYLGL
ncbi:hypothetical protein HDG34_005118 [Paraburkholderia sp. HC6.4b]|nr:hypothetical protein [Paraburkholderia sp. HC6.4b]MBB5453930.1 hypothetical protein [Paraburkholderia sp. Kb1A]